MAADVDIVRAVARAPLRTLRLKEVPELARNTWRTTDRLVEQGALVRLAHGVYTAVPDGRDGRTWKPPLEAAALALATARFGAREVALMGVSAARHWAAIPRAIGVATVAVPRRGYAPVTLEGGGLVKFVPRNMDALELVLERTGLGEGLVTTPEQTLFDLLGRMDRDGLGREVAGAVENLTPQVKPDEFAKIVARARIVPAGARDMRKRLETANG
ncbi:type IV toxin-antitoxin system AbiEi family antitoxin [Microbacterium sp. bgisy207]|uniref:type IV toxin-antitoxin system AbiEi family antitoxin n=1 Tax=Microbacterium sp. bgisy207 TaxID=3413800 RepID=UPI003EBFADF2